MSELPESTDPTEETPTAPVAEAPAPAVEAAAGSTAEVPASSDESADLDEQPKPPPQLQEPEELNEETSDIPVGMQGLDPSARMLFHLQALIRLVTVQWPMATMIGVGVALLGGGVWMGLGAGAATGFGFFLLALWYPSLSFDRWGYELRDEDLLIQRGVLFRSLTAIPTARVQHVDTRQGPLEQWIGLARVQIYTAAGMGADGIIPGLDLRDAEALRDELVRRHGDDGV